MKLMVTGNASFISSNLALGLHDRVDKVIGFTLEAVREVLEDRLGKKAKLAMMPLQAGDVSDTTAHL